MDADKTALKVATVYDNYLHEPGLKEGFGFSCLVRAGDINILFDTGAEPKGLLYNMGRMGIKPEGIDIVFLSHGHDDHTGGLAGLLKVRPEAKVYLLKSFSYGFRKDVKAKSSGVVEVSGPGEIYRGVTTTGEMGTSVKEQALVINTEKGLVVITGCAHPGIVNVVKEVKTIMSRNVHMVLGGFHLKGMDDKGVKEVISSLKRMGVEKAGPCHCTGNRARELFRDHFGDGFVENGAGARIDV